MFTVVTGRFDAETWESATQYRKKHNYPCIYAPPVKLSPSIDLNSPVFILEMNNSLNQLMGIGLIQNKLVTDKVHKVHADSNCNRYCYIGKHHLSRDMLIYYDEWLVYVLDEILFRGKTHSKRGIGLTKIPEKVLKLDICEGVDIKKLIRNIFVEHYKTAGAKCEDL